MSSGVENCIHYPCTVSKDGINENNLNFSDDRSSNHKGSIMLL